MKIRVKSLTHRFVGIFFPIIFILSVFHCNMRDGDILGMRQPENEITGSVMADSFWSEFNFTDSTGTIRCSIAVNFRNYTIKAGYHPDSLLISYTSEYANFTLIGVNIYKSIYYQLTITTMTGDTLRDTGSIVTPKGAPPRMVKNLLATSDFYGVYLQWPPSVSASGYTVYRKEISDSTFEKIGITAGVNYFDSLQSFSSYIYSVRAYNEFGESRYAEPVTSFKIINLSPPRYLSASKGRYYHQVHLNWSPNSLARSSCIFRSDSANGPYVEIASSITDSSYIDSVKDNSLYYYKVSSQDQDGRRGPANSYDSGFARDFLDPPLISFISEGTYENKIFIYWTHVNQALAYRVYRSEEINGKYNPIATISDTFYVDYVKSTKNYYYEISTISVDSQEGPRSLFKAGYVIKSDPPLLKVDKNSQSCISLNWDTVPAAYYKIYRTNHPDSQAILIDSTENNYYCDQVSSGSIWMYLISSVSRYGVESRLSNAVIAEGPDLRAPENLSASQGTNQAFVALSWDSVAGAIGYHLYRSTPNSGSTLISSRIIDTFYIDSSAADTNYYRVCALDSTGAEGHFSDLVTGYPAPLDMVKNLTGSVDIPHTLQLSWDAASLAEGYIIYRSAFALSGPYIPVDTVHEPVYTDSTRVFAYYNAAVKYRSRTGKTGEPVYSRKLQPPTGLQLQAETDHLYLTWDQAMGASSYNIYRASDTVHFSLLTNLQDNFYHDSVVEGTYYYRVKSVSINGETNDFASTSIRLKKGVQNLSVTAAGDSLKLQWSKVPDAINYQIVFNNESGQVFYTSGIIDTFTYFTFTESDTFYFKVMANVTGYTTPFSEVKRGIVIARPLAPTLSEIQNKSGYVVLLWNANPNGEPATSYVIYRSSSAQSGYVAIDTTVATTYTDTPPTIGTTYYYKVAGINQSGKGKESNYLSGKALSISAPQNLIVSNKLYGTHIALSWSPVDGAEKYIIGRAANIYSVPVVIDTCLDTFYNDSTASSQSSMAYAIASIKGSVTSSWSVWGTGSKLIPPTNLYATGSYLYISLAWSNPSGAPKFYIYRSSDNGGSYVKIDSTFTEQYMDSVRNGNIYYYRVSCANLNESELSPGTTAARLNKPLPPATLWATEGTIEDTIAISWTASVGATHYAVYRSTNSSFTNPILVKTTGNDTSCFDPVSSDSFYYYKVKAVNFAGESVLSSFTTRGFRIPTNVPQPPTNLQSSHSSEYIYLHWTEPDYLVTPYMGFIIERSETEEGPFAVLDSVPYNAYYDEAEKSYPQQYWYHVRAYNRRGVSAPSNTVVDSRQ